MAPTAITLQLIMAQLACGLLGTQQHSAPSLGCNTCVGLECSHSQQSGKTGVAVPPVPSAAPPRGVCLEDGTGEQPRVFCSPPAFPPGEGRLHRQGRDGGARGPPLAAGGEGRCYPTHVPRPARRRVGLQRCRRSGAGPRPPLPPPQRSGRGRCNPSASLQSARAPAAAAERGRSQPGASPSCTSSRSRSRPKPGAGAVAGPAAMGPRFGARRL